MTTVGKILVVLHLVLSVMFIAFAGAVFTAQNNWRDAEKKTAATLATANTKIKDMQAETDILRADMAHKAALLESDIVKLKGQNTAFEIEVKTLTADNKQMRKEVDQQRDLAALTTTESVERKKEADLQREKNGDLYTSRDDFVHKLYKTEDERFALDGQLKEVSEKYENLLNDLKTMKSFLASKNLPSDPKLMEALTTPPPPLEGRVIDVRKPDRGSRRELIEISLGRDAGLEVGHRLTVFRGIKYLGIIRLTLVESDKSVGYVDTRAKNADFQIDDEVTTKF
jgi:hypothetical protein